MERFEVKRGLIKQIDVNGGLVVVATEHFEGVKSDSEGGVSASFGMLKSINAKYSAEGKLVVDVVQLKGEELSAFLNNEGGRELAMESRNQWSKFLDVATGYNSKQRGDKAKENSKKISKSKSAIKMAHKFMELSTSLTDETKQAAYELIADIESKLEQNNATRAMSLSDKLNKMLGS